MGALALDPLIAEAKRRARRRRLLVAAASLLACGAAVATLAVRNGEHPHAAALVPVACHSDQLRLSVPPGWGVAAGSLYESGTLTNTSGSNCSVAGWPAVRRLDAAGRRIPGRAERWVYRLGGVAPYAVVSLAPGQAATFEIFGEDWNRRLDRACREARTIQVMARGSGGWLSVTPSAPEGRPGIPACRAWLVGPLVPGRVANPPPFPYSHWKRGHRP